MRALITGSVAYDCLMRIGGRFADRWPLTADGAFAAAYTAPVVRRKIGGCAGNIAYALRRLGDEPLLMATAGEDFAPYEAHLRAADICAAHIAVLPGFFTATAYIVTDDDDNQFIVFHPGAAGEAQRQRVGDAPEAALAIVAPNGKAGMIQHCEDLAARKTPFIFDPGQAVGLFSGEELRHCLELCTYAICNAGELSALQKATGMAQGDIAAMVAALIVTRGVDGSEVFAGGESCRVAAVRLGETKDPTGCGDAYRAGLMHALLRRWSWQKTAQFAAAVAGIKALHDSPQGYELSPAMAAEICRREFGD